VGVTPTSDAVRAKNVLVTSAGRRASLVQAFKRATHARGARVFAGDASALAPTLYLADAAFRLPNVGSPDYVPHLLELVKAHDIGLVVPTIDPELGVLAAHAAAFAELGCKALVSHHAFVEISGDKWLTQQAFASHGLDVPQSWTPEEVQRRGVALPERLFVKPRDGSASRDTYRATPATLADILTRVPNAIIQEELLGPEVTIDALLDFEGQPLHYVPRVRLRTLAGESIQGVTIPDDELSGWLKGLLVAAAKLGARGPITLQAFLTDRGPVLIEVNPRFGGGFPLAYAAGGRYPEWLLQLLAGEAVPPRLGDYQRGLYMTRYNVEHFTTELLWEG
jgi:carbamoyl-phosphate synthase large subunit